MEVVQKTSAAFKIYQELKIKEVMDNILSKIQEIKVNLPLTPEGKITNHNNLGRKDFFLKNWLSAMKHFVEVAKIAVESGLLDAAVEAYFNLGNIAKNSGNLSDETTTHGIFRASAHLDNSRPK